MGDRMQRIKGKTKEMMGRTKREVRPPAHGG
jgi:hypothetical protein